MRQIEHPVGSRFEVDGTTYEVQLASSCHDCSLYLPEENECFDKIWRFGLCGGELRSDGQNVIFVQVTD